jgi:hypothetical protein
MFSYIVDERDVVCRDIAITITRLLRSLTQSLFPERCTSRKSSSSQARTTSNGRTDAIIVCDQPINQGLQRYAFARSAQAKRSTLGIASKSVQRLNSFLKY